MQTSEVLFSVQSWNVFIFSSSIMEAQIYITFIRLFPPASLSLLSCYIMHLYYVEFKRRPTFAAVCYSLSRRRLVESESVSKSITVS
jgi:hypothetical protein